jgi:hypothetical protein
LVLWEGWGTADFGEEVGELGFVDGGVVGAHGAGCGCARFDYYAVEERFPCVGVVEKVVADLSRVSLASHTLTYFN